VVRWNGASRTTAFVSATQLTATIPASDLTLGARVNVTVFNPAPGGGASSAATFTVNNPAPTLASIAPSSATAAGGAFVLTATGTNFVPNCVVQWNGSNRATTFVSATQVTAAIPASDLANGGNVQVTVVNPTPAGGTTDPQTFTINNPVPAVTSLSPASGTAGALAFNLTVNGSGFVSSSVVRWNGSDRTTTFSSSVKLTAAISAADIASVGTAQVTVFNPAPAGGISLATPFNISVSSPLSVDTSLLPATIGGRDYNFMLAVSGGSAPYTWSISSGALPGGLSIDPTTGRILGTTPTVVTDQTFNFTVSASDSTVPQRLGSRALAITVHAPGNLGSNDSCSGGVGGTAISNGRIRASISPYGDIDVYSFHGTAGKQVTIEIFAQRLDLDGNPATQDSQMDSVLELLDSSCPDPQLGGVPPALAFNDDIATGSVTDSLIQNFTLPQTDTYFIRVRDFRGDGRPDMIYELSLSGAD
jgi:hypothetical protein